MFDKILIANRGTHAEGAVASATNGLLDGAAGQAGEFPAEPPHV
jgi:hypothetical protein